MFAYEITVPASGTTLAVLDDLRAQVMSPFYQTRRWDGLREVLHQRGHHVHTPEVPVCDHRLYMVYRQVF